MASSSAPARKPLAELTEDEFLTDLITFLQANGGHKFAPAGCDPSTFPARTLNGAKLDLFGLYRSVAGRGGFPTRESRAKLNWTKDVFPDLSNYTENHRATSAGHDLIGHYQNYLLEYEEAHPDDVTPLPEQPTAPRRHGVSVDSEANDERAAAADAADADAPAAPAAPPRRGPGRPPGSGRGRGRPRGRPRGTGGATVARPRRVPRVKRRSPSDFTVGCKVKVFWRHDDAWYAGVIEDQQGEGDVVLSKIQYEDGDVEVLDLVGGRERVRLMERADGTPASDADEPDVFDEEELDDDDDERRRNRDRDRRRGRSTAGLSRRAAAKESSPPERAAGSTPVESERRRNPARLAALANAREGNLLNLAAHEEFPPGDERVAAVLEAMRGNDAARTLAELPEDPEPSGEVFRLGYRMGARRAIACCAALVAAAAARAPSLAPTGRTRTPTARAAEFKAAEAHRAAANHQRNKKGQETSAKETSTKEGGETAGETETATAATATAARETQAERASDASPKPAEESESARAAREAEAASMARGAELREAAAADGGAWDDPLAFASRDPALRAAMEKLEAILAEEVFDPAGWEEGGWYDTDDDEAGVAGALPNASDAARRAIDPALVAGVLDVDAAAEKRRAARGLSGPASRRPKSQHADAVAVAVAGAVKSVKSETNVARVSDMSAPMTPEQVVAAAFAEAAEKRVAAEAALAAILDPVKLAQVREDALKAKPTTTAGRLIKAANNADARAEKIKAGGGGDGRALRVQGIRKAGPGRPPGSGSRGRGGGGGGGGSRAPAKPSEATLMEKSGPGAEAYEFRPPLAPTPEATAARAYELAAAGSDEEADAATKETEASGGKDAASADPAAEPEPASKAGKSSEKKGSSAETATGFDGPAAANDGGDDEKRRKRPRTGAQGWGDGGRSVGGDATVTRWLTARGWGEYAAGFAARAVDFARLGSLTLQDLEDLSVDGTIREKMLAAAAEFSSSRKEGDGGKRAEGSPAKRQKKTA